MSDVHRSPRDQERMNFSFWGGGGRILFYKNAPATFDAKRQFFLLILHVLVEEAIKLTIIKLTANGWGVLLKFKS